MLIKFMCNNPDCGNNISKFFKTHKDIPMYLDCGNCGSGKLEREFAAPSSKTTVTVDNGLQAKSVEIMSEVIEQEMGKVNRD